MKVIGKGNNFLPLLDARFCSSVGSLRVAARTRGGVRTHLYVPSQREREREAEAAFDASLPFVPNEGGAEQAKDSAEKISSLFFPFGLYPP